MTTAADGTRRISWPGAKTGTDTLTAFVDRDGNGSWDVNTEPRQIVTATFAPLPPPVPGKSVNVQRRVRRGVRQAPRRATRTREAPGKGFVPFDRAAANIPVGSQLDTRKGRVNLVSAAETGGKKTQASNFYDGIFQVKQALPKKKPKKAVALTTDIILKGQLPRSQCAPLKGASAAAVEPRRRRVPRRSSASCGVTARASSAPPASTARRRSRGTIWLTSRIECDGTLTKVTRGVVQVRDFKRKKTVTVKAGHSYLARAQRAASKSGGERHERAGLSPTAARLSGFGWPPQRSYSRHSSLAAASAATSATAPGNPLTI